MLGILLTIVIVPIVLTAMSGQKETDSICDFRMNINKGVCLLIGGIGSAFMTLCLYGSILGVAGKTDYIVASPWCIAVSILFLIPCLLFLLLPAKGFYDNEVHDDTLYARRWFVIRKELPISEIGHCVMKSNQYGGSIRVYTKSGECFCWIDLMQCNVENFITLMKKKGIPLKGAKKKTSR